MLLRPMMLLCSTFNVYKDNVSKVIIKKIYIKTITSPKPKNAILEYSRSSDIIAAFEISQIIGFWQQKLSFIVSFLRHQSYLVPTRSPGAKGIVQHNIYEAEDDGSINGIKVASEGHGLP